MTESPGLQFVLKRGGIVQQFNKTKLHTRLQMLTAGTHSTINIASLVSLVVEESPSLVYSTALDEIAARIAASHAIFHPDYSTIAGRLIVSQLHKKTRKLFSDTMEYLFQQDIISSDLFELVERSKDVLDTMIVHNRDYQYSYQSITTLKDHFLLSVDGQPVERPQHSFMRIALSLHSNDLNLVLECYESMSTHRITHAPEIFYGAGTIKPWLSTYVTRGFTSNNIANAFDAIKDCTLGMNHAGESSISLQYLSSTKEWMSERGPQGGMERALRLAHCAAESYEEREFGVPGLLTLNLDIWHQDILRFITDSNSRPRPSKGAQNTVHHSVWIPDAFMNRLANDEKWPLFCPVQTSPLLECSSDIFSQLLLAHEALNIGDIHDARDIWNSLIRKVSNGGGPSVMFTDAVNHKSNEQNLGTIRATNSTADKVQYASDCETATCSSGSLILPSFITGGAFEYTQLINATKVLTRNLDAIVELTSNKSISALSNWRIRAIGINIQGLADAMISMGIAMDSGEATGFNRSIAEAVYYAALDASCELAESKGRCSGWDGSPGSEGCLQYDLWKVTPSDAFDWTTLKNRIKVFGLRNLLLISLRPTPSSYNITDTSPGTDPITSHLRTQHLSTGEFHSISPQLVADLTKANLWDEDTRTKIIENGGSIQAIDSIPATIKAVYKTANEMDQYRLIDLAADRGPYVCQSQSMTFHGVKGDVERLGGLQIYAWKKGLKTGINAYNLV